MPNHIDPLIARMAPIEETANDIESTPTVDVTVELSQSPWSPPENEYFARKMVRAFTGLEIMFLSSRLYDIWSDGGKNYSESGMLGATLVFMAGYALAIIPPSDDSF